MSFKVNLTQIKKGSNHAEWRLHPDHDIDNVDLVECGIYQLTFIGPVRPQLKVLDADHLPDREIVKQDKDGDQYELTWRLELLDFAGETTFSLWEGQSLLWGSSFEIKPLAGKLSPESYLTMMEELPLALSSVLQGVGNVQLKWTEGELEASMIASLVAIKTYGSDLERCFQSVVQQANRELVSRQSFIPLHTARKVSRSSLSSLIRNAGLKGAIESKGQNTKSLMISSFSRMETFATPANCFLKHVLGKLYDRCTVLETKLRFAMGKEKQGFAQKRLEFFYGLTRDFGTRLARLEATSFFRDLKPASLSQSGVQSISSHPVYARFYKMSSAILKPQFCLSPKLGELAIPTIPTWHIYEYWVMCRVMVLVKEVLSDIRWEIFGEWESRSVSREWDSKAFYQLLIVGKSKSAGLEVQLSYQEEFPAYHSKRELPKKRGLRPEDFRSISGTMVPDLFLRVSQRGQTKAIVLDAKYRTNETAIKQSLDAIHIYKNGLRNGEVPTCGAFILVPAYVDRVEQYFTNEYRNKFHFGGFRFHPNETDDQHEFKQWFSRWVVKWPTV